MFSNWNYNKLKYSLNLPIMQLSHEWKLVPTCGPYNNEAIYYAHDGQDLQT